MKNKGIYYSVGALLYCPANKEKVSESIINEKLGKKYSLALCLEDSINDNLVKEAEAEVFATDLWISATENQEQFEKWGIQEQVIPIHANADDLPYAKEYFDAMMEQH